MSRIHGVISERANSRHGLYSEARASDRASQDNGIESARLNCAVYYNSFVLPCSGAAGTSAHATSPHRLELAFCSTHAGRSSAFTIMELSPPPYKERVVDRSGNVRFEI